MMSSVFIDRPRLAVVISIVITLAGLVALTQIPIAQFPDIVPPQITVTAATPAPAPKWWRPRWRSRSSRASSASTR